MPHEFVMVVVGLGPHLTFAFEAISANRQTTRAPSALDRECSRIQHTLLHIVISAPRTSLAM